MLKTFYNKYKLILLGLIIFSAYIWVRFLRSRTSKILPLNLTVLGFFTLLNVCCIFTYIIISLIKSRKKNPVIEGIIDWLFIPIMEFDNFLKNTSLIKPYYIPFVFYLIPKLEHLIIKTNLFFIIFWIIPRMILLTALFIDVFIFHKLHYKYLVILFGLLLFFNRYFKYSLKNIKNKVITDLTPDIYTIITNYYPGVHPAELEPNNDEDDDDDDNMPPTMALPLNIFVEFQTESIVYRNKTNFMRVLTSDQFDEKVLTEFQEEFNNKFKKSSFQFVFEKKKTILEPKINELLKLSLLIEYYNKTSNSNENFNKLKILIYITYLICWLYVLIISFHTLNIKDLIIVLNETWLTLQDPFTDDLIINFPTKDLLINLIKDYRKKKVYTIIYNILQLIINKFK